MELCFYVFLSQFFCISFVALDSMSAEVVSCPFNFPLLLCTAKSISTSFDLKNCLVRFVNRKSIFLIFWAFLRACEREKGVGYMIANIFIHLFLFYKRIFKSTCFTSEKYWPKLQRNLSGDLKFGLSRVNHLYRTKAFKI